MKKPFTVLVGVVIVMVLGVVSFMRMTPDLLPNMDFPYVLVITAWPGATPEKVENNVTKPLEQSMATLEKIKQVSSVSRENSSTVILEFQQDVNMDTITVDILQNISQIKEYWEDTVSTPIIMKINPSMMPLMITAVDMEGYSPAEMTAFTNDTLLNKLEGTTGVASVTARGLIEEQIWVELNESKIKKQNKRIAKAIDGQFAEAENELNIAKNEVRSGLSEIENGLKELESAKGQLANGAGQADAEVFKQEQELIDAKIALSTEILKMEQNKKELNQTLSILTELKKSLDELNATKTTLEQAKTNLGDIPTQLAQLEITNAVYEAQFAQMTDEQIAVVKQTDDYKKMQADFAAIDTELAKLNITREQALAVDAEILALDTALSVIDTSLADMGMKQSDLGPAIDELHTGIKTLDKVIPAMKETLSQIESGALSAADALADMGTMQANGLLTLSDTTSQLLVGQASLNLTLQQLESGQAEIDNAKKTAKEQADLGNVITMNMVSGILMAQNFSMPAGYVSEDGVNYLVRVGDEITSVEELQSLLLFDPEMDGVPPIYLKDVADVKITDNSDRVYAKIDGRDGVLLTFNKQSTFATATVSDNVNQRFEELKAEYPGLSFVNLMDQGDYIYVVINSILQNLVLGAIFAIIILFLFLWDLRPTFITLCSIPISVLFALVLMYFSGVSINIISLSGLAVSVGMLVDNSVVVIENTFRLRNRGEPSVRAAVSGATQVGGAIISSTLTTICVFLPIVFVEGITRQLFTDMALTIAYSLIASLIVALTLVPAMSSALLKKDKPRKDTFIRKYRIIYRKTLGWTLDHKAPLLIAVVVLLVGSIGLVYVRGFAFMPEMESSELMVTLEAPKEYTIDETKELADKVAEEIRGLEGIETVGAMLSGGGGMLGLDGSTSDTRSVVMYALMKTDSGVSGNKTAEEITQLSSKYDGEITASGTSSMGDYMTALGGSGITVEIYGENMDDLMEAARTTAKVLEGMEGTANVDDGIGETNPEIRFVVNKDKAMKKGLTVAQVYAEVAKALTESSTSTTISYNELDHSVLIINPNDDELTPDYIRSYKFKYTDALGNTGTVALRDIASVEETETATSIQRVDQRRYITVSADVKSDYNVTLMTREAEQLLQGENISSAVSYEFTGENETIMDSINDLLKMLLLGVLLVYLIMVAQFQSLKSPFIVMFTIPLAFTGGFLALLITGQVLSVVALIGFVMLCGIIVNNGIVLIDYVNQLRADGVERREALIEAGTTRLRPILMTSLTTILGLFTMALGLGQGAELMQPVAIVCIGGLLYATVLTLFVIPVLYDLFNRKEIRVVKDEDLEVIDD